jgi:hypothetical protein
VPRHVARIVTWLVAPLVVDFSTSRWLVVDYSASRRLVVDKSAARRLVVGYFDSAARPGASARRAARRAAHRAASRRLLHLVQACRRLLRLRCASGCLGMSHRSSLTSPPRTGLSSTTSPPPRVRVPRHVVRLVTRLVAPLVVDYFASPRLVVDYSTSCRLVVYYSASAERPRASPRRGARHAARRAARC